MQTANVPEWVLSALFVSNLASNSSFSAFCRETVVLLRYIHDPENTKCLAFHTVIPRLNANQLILLHQWIQSNHHLQFPEARILDLLMEMESIKQFMKTADGPDPVQELVPLDQSYWKSIKSVFSPSLDPEVLELMLDLVQFEYKQQWICATIDSKLLGQNSVLQLSFIRSQDQQFRLSFASVNPLLIECLYPVFLSLKNILKEALDDINKNSDFLSPLKRLLNFVAQFWNHWNKTDLKSCQHPSFLMESSIYTWIKIKKYTKLLTVALSKNSKASAEWKIASMSLDQALELPENVPQKLLLWKYGSHPKLHRSLTSALHHSKLNQICQIFNINGSPCWEGANEVTGLLQDLHILRGCSDSTPEIRGLVLKLSGDTNLRKVLIEGLSMTSLTAYASRSPLESDQVITEVLESCVQQIQSLVNKQRAPSELLPNLSTYEVFLSPDQLTDPANVDLQLDLASLHWTLFTSKPIPATLNFMMEVINTHQPKYEVQQGSLRELKDWESEGISRSLFPLTLFQSVKDLVWMLEMDPNEVLYSRENALTLLTNVLYEWQLNLSMNQIQFLPNDYIIQGASVLYQGTLANSVGSMLAKVPSILEAPGKIIQLKLAARLLISSSSSMSTETHWDHIRVHIVTCLMHILASHASSLPEANQEPFTQLLISVWQSMKWKSHGTELEADQHLIRCLRLQLRLSHHETLVSCIDGLILPCCQSLMKSKRSSGLETVLSLGHAWIYLGALRVTLVHPPAGFDPSTKQQMKSQNLEFLLETKLRPLLKLRQEINGLPGGFDETEKIKKLSGEIEELESKLEELRETMVPRPEPSQYLELYSHIHQFITMHCSAERIQNLLTCFQSNDCLNAVSKSENWIVVCRHFIQQTSVRFPLYIDIWQPICHGLLELSHGFSALTSFGYLKSKSEPFYSTVTCSAMELMKIDSTCSKSSPMELSKVLMEASASLLGNIGEQEAFHVQLKYLMARLNHSKEMVVGLEGFPDCPEEKQNFCSLALSLMSVFEKLQVIEEAHLSEKSQLFKTQISHGETDEELVEASYHSMFPDEAKYFADLTQHHMNTSLVHEMDLKDNQQSHTGSLLDGSVAKTVAKIHQEVFNGINRIPKNTGDFEMRFSTGLELLDVIGKVVPRQFDDQISLGCLMRLCKEHRKLTRRPVQHSSQSCFIDFYSSCPEEVQLTHQCLIPLNSRLNQLLEDWPEHPLLTQIQEFSTRVLALSIECPLKRVMTGLELMLSRAQLWEDTVASKKLSLNSELKLVSKLITRWQRMELENWKTVLDRIKTRHAEDARKTWFYILRILLPSDSLSTADLTSTLEQYLITSTQGEFSERLMILFSFHNQIQDQQQYPLNHILANLVGFYSQYKTPVQSALESGLKPIEKELLEFVKLQNWEDRGYYNLMKTGERSQRKLHKFCMRAEEILKQPMAAILSQHVQSMGYTDLNQKLEETQDSSISVIPLQKPLELALDVHHEVTEDWTGLLSSVGTGSRFQELPRLVKKMSEILKSSWVPKTQHSGCSLGDLSNSVIARVRALQQDTEKNSKGRKKKALSDFLNLLPSLGISKRKSDVPENEQTILSWFQQPTMDQLPSWTDQLGLSKQKTQQVLDSANGYYFKCMDRMQRVWETGVQPNKALSLNEVNLMMKFSEHFLFVLRQQRQVLRNTNQSLTRLISVLNLVNGLCTVGGKPPLPDQHSVAESLCSQWNILKELKQAVMAERELLEHIDEVEDHELVSQAIKRCSDQCETSMECINSCISSLQIVQSRTAPCIYIHKDQQIIQNNFESLLGLCVKLKDHQNGDVESQRLKELGFGCNSDMACIAGWSELMNVFDSAINKVQDALNCLNTKQMSVSETGVPNYDEFSQNIESCIVELMLWFQKQHQEGPPSTSVSILETNQQFQDHLSYNKINRIFSCLFDCIQKISEMSETAYKTEDPDLCENLVQGATLMAKTTQCLEPAGHLLIQRVIHLWTELLDHHRSTSKLCYITMSVFLGLLKEGFCNEESEDGEEEGEGNFDSGDGTGLSSGQGLKDISDEIENEDQILGTEDNTDEIEKSNNNNESEEQNKGIEMEQDFNGTYENIEQELEQEEEDSGEEDDNQIENEMGKVGEDGEAVDEKLWNDEDNSDEKDQTTHDGNNYPQTGDQEYIEGQLEDSEETKQDSKESKRDPEIIPRQQDQEESAEEGDEETEGGSEEAEGPPMEGFTKPEPPEEELDLPEDLNLDTEGPNDDQDSLASTENADPAELEEPVVQKFAEEEDGDLDGMEVDQETTTAPQDEPEVVPEDDVNEEGGTKEETMTPEDSTIPEGTEAAAIGHQEGALELEEQDLGLAMRHENQNSIEESSCAATAPVPSRTGPVEYRTDLEQNTRHSDHQEVVQKHSVNPLRSLGDALEQWKEDLRVVDPETKDNRNPETQTGEAEEYEFLMEQAPDSLQTIAHATEDQMKQMGDLEEPLNEQKEDSCQIQEQDDFSLKDPKTVEQGPAVLKEKSRTGAGPVKLDEQDLMEEESDVEMEELEKNEDPVEEKFAHWKLHELDAMTEDQEQEKVDPTTTTATVPAVQDPFPVEISSGQRLWNQCQASTSSLASELTEHLRLILEPTLASRLAGDYRTGKRINMKRVIPYIASQYRKDKIWLRRTKPDKRKYQVLLAVDDSQSMSNIGCGAFALESLTLISRAMSRLEVGEIGLLSFGGSGEINILHSLGVPFTDSHGPQIMQQLKFNQDNRIEDRPMLQLIKSLDGILQSAEKQYCTNHELHQLVTIIADGRFHERSTLKQEAHKLCTKPGVLVVFVILDNPNNSLVDMTTVEFEDGKPQFKKYLDHFPFPYYIVLNDISALPRTLADLLRQWFQISST